MYACEIVKVFLRFFYTKRVRLFSSTNAQRATHLLFMVSHLFNSSLLTHLDQRPLWQRYGLALAFISLTLIIAMPLRPYLDIANIAMLFLLNVVVVAVKLGRHPAILTVFASVAALDFFFVPPYWTLVIGHMQYLFTFVVMLVVALTITYLTAGLRQQAREANNREQQTLTLYELQKVAQEAQLQMASERLRSSILAALSHDIRTPLTSLYGLAESLSLIKPPLPLEAQELALAIRDQALHVHNMVSNLLEMARLQTSNMKLRKEWQPLEEVIGSSTKLLKLALQQHSVKVNLPADLPLLEFDAVLLERVFCNLLENAAKYSPAETPITINATILASTVEVCVCNQGDGIAPEKLQHIFDLFERGNHESTVVGVGLGLSICRAIIEAHGGKIEAKNQLSGGSCICFYLPLGNPPLIEEEPTTGKGIS